MKYPFALLLVLSLSASAQTPQVPHKIQFAGMTLNIHDDARREIQKDVDALTQSPRHFNMKVERAKTYFPIIEKIFEEERLPDDFKYLVLQESALIPDAVSASKAVGFWQFKDFTAVEMGLRVDKEVDERMNVVSSTRAAARYIKKNNFFFNNWLYALQAYQMGAGGVMESVRDPKSGAQRMDITGKTYWYVKKYLAHKIAFEGAVQGPGQLQVAPLQSEGKANLKDVARELSISEDELMDYNKWIRKNRIPDDKDYAILVPVNDVTKDFLMSAKGVAVAERIDRAPDRPVEGTVVALSTRGMNRSIINGVPAVEAKPGENATAFAARTGITLSYFLKCNDIAVNHRLNSGAYYFISKKRNRAEQDYHKVTEGESMWQISQQYGVKLKSVLRFNRMSKDSKISPGTMVYLSGRRPKDTGNHALPEEVIEVDKNSLFAWSVDPEPQDAKSDTGAPDNTLVQPASNDLSSESNAVSDTAAKRVVSEPVPVNDKEVLSEGDEGPETVDAEPGVATEQHVVLSGETLYGISRKYNVGVMDLVTWNNLDINDRLKPGQVLNLAGPSVESETAKKEINPTAVKDVVYEVGAADTLYSVARKYGVTIKELMEWNGKNDFNIHVGEKLKIKKQ
jgi:peptidoglycan lytic transglycosylase D